MKRVILVSLAGLAAHLCYGQKTEYSAHLTSGFFAYRGASAVSTATIYVFDVADAPSYTSNPYGNKLGLSYGLAAQVQRVTRKHSLWGVQAGYEVLRSRVKIDQVYAFRTEESGLDGRTNLAHHFINVHPFFGHRFAVKAVDLDLTAGPEVGFLRSVREKGKVKTSNGEIKTDVDRNTRAVDPRLRLNLTGFYRHLGLSAGYSFGLHNYRKGYVGTRTNDLFSQAFRLGAVYRFN